MPHSQLDSLGHIRRVFEDSGVSVSAWARANGFSTALVYQVLHGQRKCMRGQSFEIAVALGLKPGKPLGVAEVSKLLETSDHPEKAREATM